LKTSELIGTNGPSGKGKRKSTLWVRRSKVTVTECRILLARYLESYPTNLAGTHCGKCPLYSNNLDAKCQCHVRPTLIKLFWSPCLRIILKPFGHAALLALTMSTSINREMKQLAYTEICIAFVF